jgi:hypothetical protein
MMVVALMTQRRGYYNSSTLKASTRSGDVFWCCVSHSAIRFLISSAKIGKFSEINKKKSKKFIQGSG